MILDRLETLSAITFVEPAISKKAESGKNCLFVRVESDKLILTGGGEFVVKKAILIRPNTVEEAAKTGNKKLPPKTFMIPRADLCAFKEMMKQHKSDCINLAKNDPSYLFVEMDDKELISHDGKIVYQQPIFEFKELESVFQVKKNAVSEMIMMSGDISAAMTGFRKSIPVMITYTGSKKPVHFEQGDYEAIVVPPLEKEEENDNGEQLEINE